jgi:UDP-N-acetylmuramate dehydrogenase
MRIEENFSLLNYNTFRLPVRARWFMEYENEAELDRVLRDEYVQECMSIHIGRGSNLLFLGDYDGIVLHSNIRGITLLEESDETVLLRVGSGEVWDDVVACAVSRGWGGIENLSLIPGETGAAAVQNIGAYGVEIRDAIETVEACSRLTFKKRFFIREACAYGYRESFFKNDAHEPYIITHVNLRLRKQPLFSLDYGALRERLSDCRRITLSRVREAVIAIRREKLPDPEEVGNAGSFFMNPVVPVRHLESLRERYPEMPCYPVDGDEGRVKIPAGWLIEQSGFKGKRSGNVGVYDKQALVIVSYGNTDGQEIARFAGHIREAVRARFGIELIPEVKFIG